MLQFAIKLLPLPSTFVIFRAYKYCVYNAAVWQADTPQKRETPRRVVSIWYLLCSRLSARLSAGIIIRTCARVRRWASARVEGRNGLP